MKTLYLSLVAALLCTGVIGTQYLFDKEKAKAGYVEPMVLRPELMKAIDLGLHNAAADLMWLGAIQYFGGGESQDNSKLPDFLNFTSDMDPKFSYPYAFGALILPSIGYVDEGLSLADKAIKNKVEDWRVPYYIATTYHFDKNDSVNAAKFFDLAANTKGAPENIQRIAANYGAKTERRDQTKQIWIGIFENSTDEVVKERAKKYIIHFETLDFLEEAATQYKKVYNKYPITVDDLVTGRILKAVPPDPFGFEFIFDDQGQPKIKPLDSND